MKQKQDLLTLYQKLISRTISDNELSWLLQYFERNQLDDLYAMTKTALELSDEELSQQPSEEEIARETRIYNFLEKEIVRKVSLWPRIAIAVAVAATVFGVSLFYYNLDRKQEQSNQIALKNDVAPGRAGATLTLASGKKIILGNAAKGDIAEEAGIVVTKTADGQIAYQIKESSSDENKINTLTTAKGQTYMLTLPDKSKVWLNAASSLTFSVGLREHGLRMVKLEGEAYFKVAKDKQHPFIVSSGNQHVEVLGTEFNVNAYPDEKVFKTTLLEGSVRLSEKGEMKILVPGMQAVNSKGHIEVNAVDTESAVAWKKNKFMFERLTIEEIMRIISRWYNVEVIYQGGIPEGTLWGSVSRYDNISKVLETLEGTGGVHFKIDGRKIYVSK